MIRQCVARSIPYWLAVVVVTLAFAGRMVLQPLLGDNRPFLTFFAAVAVAGWIGGKGPAIFAAVTSYLIANLYLMPPSGEFHFNYAHAEDWADLITFFVLSAIIVWPTLAMRRAQATAEAGSAQIAELLAEANHANRRKEVFLATLSHELRNPLSPISNALQLWPRVAGDPTEMEDLRIVMSRQVKQLTRLLDDLMDITRISSGKIELRKSAADLGTAIAGAVETARPLIEAFGHQLTVATPAEPLLVCGDPARLTQIFTNLLFNAAKYTPRNGAIAIAAERRGDSAVVRVRDNGPGVPAHLLTKIFDPFYQIERTLQSSQGGLGIGLALVKQLAELHGGIVEAHSETPGSGSEFVVTLPALAAPAKSSPSQPQKPQADLGRSCILVVDDLMESAETLAKVLRSLGQDAFAVYDGETAIQWIVEHKPDLVLLDIAMPGLDGYEVARRLHARQELRAMLIVALTGFGQREDRVRALEAGFDYHLTKPANMAELEEMLRRLSIERAASAEPASC